MVSVQIIITYLLIYGVFSEEPIYSRFQYDELLLEKMIRMEVKFEAMEKLITKANTEVQENLKSLQKEREEYKRTFVEMKDMQETPTIVFKARQPIDMSLETNQKIVFTHTMIDEGGAYSNITGIFTAPIDGTYLFTIHLCVSATQQMFYGIVRDHIVETSGRFYDKSYTVCHSADAIIVLEAGQNVWVKCLHGSGGTTNVLFEQTSSPYIFWNTFSGTLIHK